jgi:hypothetical protein
MLTKRKAEAVKKWPVERPVSHKKVLTNLKTHWGNTTLTNYVLWKIGSIYVGLSAAIAAD